MQGAQRAAKKAGLKYATYYNMDTGEVRGPKLDPPSKTPASAPAASSAPTKARPGRRVRAGLGGPPAKTAERTLLGN